LLAFTTQQAVGVLETLSGTLSGTLLETLPVMEKSMGKGFVQKVIYHAHFMKNKA